MAARGTGQAGGRAGQQGSLALDFAADAISLYERERDGSWELIGSAGTDATDFAAEIARLRAIAGERDPTDAPVTLWLPADQIIERHHQLLASGHANRDAEAAGRLASDTTHLAPELAVAIASSSRSEPVKVLAVLLQTMVEARSYSANWGFTPGPISTRVSAEGFPPPGPIFSFPGSTPAAAGSGMNRFAAAVLAVAIVGGSAFAGWTLLAPMLEPPVAVNVSVPRPASFAVFVDPPLKPQNSSSSRVRKSGGDDLKRIGTPEEPARETGSARPEQPGVPETEPVRAESPRVPETAATENTVTALSVDVGKVHAAPPETLGAPPEADVALATQPVDPTDREALDEDLAPSARAPAEMAAAPRPRPDRNISGDMEAEIAAAPVSIEPEREEDGRSLTVSATEAGPVVPDAPLPQARSEAIETASISSDKPSSVLPEGKRAPRIEERAGEIAELAVLTVKPTARIALPPAPMRLPGTTNNRSDPPGTGSSDDQQETSNSTLTDVPDPPKRPRTLEIARRSAPTRQTPRSATPLTLYLPSEVGRAATQTGLSLKETSVIGIMDGAKGGRQALLRLPDGAFRKVANGDTIDGWRVRSISREAVRLTRRGEKKTLLLVTR